MVDLDVFSHKIVIPYFWSHKIPKKLDVVILFFYIYLKKSPKIEVNSAST